MAQAAPKQFLFVSQRDIVVTSTQGYSIEFKKGEPTHVPRAMHKEVLDKGIVAVDAADAAAVTVEAAPPAVLVAPEDGDARKEKIVEAIRATVKRNSSKDFTAAGVPTAGAVSALTGWRAEPSEIRAAWAEMGPEVLAGGSK